MLERRPCAGASACPDLLSGVSVPEIQQHMFTKNGEQFIYASIQLWMYGLHALQVLPFDVRVRMLGLGLGLGLIKTEYWDRAGGGGNISYDW